MGSPTSTMSRRFSLAAALTLLLATGTACSGDAPADPAAVDAGGVIDGGSQDGAGDDAAATADTGPADAGPTKPEVTWGACTGTYQGIQPQCATLQLPVDWSNPEGDTIPIHVARVKATQPRRGALWMLQGGPGGDGSGLASIAADFAKRVPDLDIYLPDHRGTGLSARLGCEKEEAANSIGGASIASFEWHGCLSTAKKAWGDKLDHFTTSYAARDLHAWMNAVREPGDEIHVYGVSYGTYWAHRYLQIFPKEPTGVVLDSVCPPGECVGDQYDIAFNNVGKAFLDLCGEDTICKGKLGDDPWATLGKVYDKVQKEKHCPEFVKQVPPLQIRMLLAALLKQFQMRTVIPAIIYRLNRCDPADVQVLQKVIYLMQYLGGGLLPEPNAPSWAPTLTFSQLLNAHILMSEMWSDPAPSYAKVQADFLSTYIAPGATYGSLSLFDKWPKYPRDAFVGKFATTDVPVLLLNGTLDPQTPDYYAKAMHEGLKAPNKQLVLLAGAAHGTVNQAPTFAGGMCGLELSVQFFKDPKKPLDKACVGLLLPVTFTLPPYIVKQFLGVNDLFENGKTDDLGGGLPKPAEAWSPTPGLPRWQ